MSKWWHKCCVCDKTVKRKTPDFKGRVICNKCKSEEKTINCLECGTPFRKRVSKRLFCSVECSGKYNGEHILKGRTLSKIHREKLSKSATSFNNGRIRTKYFEIYSPYQHKIVSVQGTYELKYAEYLNKNNIKWIRSRQISIQYKRNENDIIRNYFPDFYLVDNNHYIEVKGYFSPNDKIKMNLVITQNINKKIKILQKEDLESLGIILNR